MSRDWYARRFRARTGAKLPWPRSAACTSGSILGKRGSGWQRAILSGCWHRRLKTLRRSGHSADVEAILRFATESGALEIVVGMPTSMSGEEGSAGTAHRRVRQARSRSRRTCRCALRTSACPRSRPRRCCARPERSPRGTRRPSMRPRRRSSFSVSWTG